MSVYKKTDLTAYVQKLYFFFCTLVAKTIEQFIWKKNQLNIMKILNDIGNIQYTDRTDNSIY